MAILKSVQLPEWLDDIIYNEFGAVYEPRPQDVEYNPDQQFEFVQLYLGTYFPRSYAEAYFGAEILGGAKAISKKGVLEIKTLYSKK